MLSTVLVLGCLVAISSSLSRGDQLQKLKLNTEKEYIQRKLDTRLLKKGHPISQEKRSDEQASVLRRQGLPVRVMSEDERKAFLRDPRKPIKRHYSYEKNDFQYEKKNEDRKREYEYARDYKKPLYNFQTVKTADQNILKTRLDDKHRNDVEDSSEQFAEPFPFLVAAKKQDVPKSNPSKDSLRKEKNEPPALPVEKQQVLKKDWLKRELMDRLPVHIVELGRPIEQIIYTKKDMKNPSENDSPIKSELIRGRDMMKRKFKDLPSFRELKGKMLRKVIDDTSDDQEPPALPVEKQQVLKKDWSKRELMDRLPVHIVELGRPIEQIIYTKKDMKNPSENDSPSKSEGKMLRKVVDDTFDDQEPPVLPVEKQQVLKKDILTDMDSERDEIIIKKELLKQLPSHKEMVGKPIEQVIYQKKRDMRPKDQHNNNQYDNLFNQESADDLEPIIKEDSEEIVQKAPVVKDSMISEDADVIKIDNSKSVETQRNDETVQSFHDENEEELENLGNANKQKKRDFKAMQRGMGYVHFETRQEFLARKDALKAKKQEEAEYQFDNRAQKPDHLNELYFNPQ